MALRKWSFRMFKTKENPKKQRRTYSNTIRAPRSRPAKFPEGPWPIELTIALAAAFLNYDTTGELLIAVNAGEAPPPTATRGKTRVPLWSRTSCERFVAQRHMIDESSNESIKDLI
jgi:hypothetical protein